jgi:hypothetical protein
LLTNLDARLRGHDKKTNSVLSLRSEHFGRELRVKRFRVEDCASVVNKFSGFFKAEVGMRNQSIADRGIWFESQNNLGIANLGI